MIDKGEKMVEIGDLTPEDLPMVPC